MKGDFTENIVRNVAISVVLENTTPEERMWSVYLINLKQETIHMVLVSSRGYGIENHREVRTSTLCHSIGDIDAQDYALIEYIDERIFGLTNEYWLSYYVNGQLYDKKFIFLPESVVEANMIRIPILNKAGVMIN